jgi:TolA-binding protein
MPLQGRRPSKPRRRARVREPRRTGATKKERNVKRKRPKTTTKTTTTPTNAYNLKTPEVQCLIDKYELFANTFPDDTASAGYLYKSADLYIGIKNYKAAAKSYEKVIHDYPKYSKMSYCIFLAGFNAENNLHDIEMAKKYYTLFLQNYPNASMAKDVQFSLQNLGRSADDIVKEFEEKLKLQDSLKTL